MGDQRFDEWPRHIAFVQGVEAKDIASELEHHGLRHRFLICDINLAKVISGVWLLPDHLEQGLLLGVRCCVALGVLIY